MLYQKRTAFSEKALIVLSAALALVPIGGIFGIVYLIVHQISNAL
jgi:hypothetical protein